MLVPLIRTLQTHLPQAKLTWIISRPSYELVEGIEGVEFIVIQKPKGVMDYWRFKKSLKKRRFDVLLALQASFRANLLYPFISATRKIGYDKLRAKDGHNWFVNETIEPGKDHTLECFLKFLKPLNIHTRELRWELAISPSDYQFAKQFIPAEEKLVILINPAASKPERNWTLEGYIKLIDIIQKEYNGFVILTGGPTAQDSDLGLSITQATSGCLNLIGKTKPKQLLALISYADILICPDTGPSHMGSAVGTPVLGLHAVTSSKVSCSYLYPEFVVDCYPEAVKTVFKKDPNAIQWGTHVHGTDAMQLITLDAVLQKLDLILSQQLSKENNLNQLPV